MFEIDEEIFERFTNTLEKVSKNDNTYFEKCKG